MKIHRLIKKTCSIAAEDNGMQKANRIAEVAQKRYKELCRENASDSKALRMHTYKRIYPGIAVYETMRADALILRPASDTAVQKLRQPTATRTMLYMAICIRN